MAIIKSGNSTDELIVNADGAARFVPVDTNGNELDLSTLSNSVSTVNSSDVTLASAATFTGTSSDVSRFNSVIVSIKTDFEGTLYMEFSSDGTNWDSSLSFSVAAATNEVHRLTVSKKYYRTRFTNTSASTQTYFRLQTMFGSFQSLTTGLNSTVQRDADALLVRPMDFNLMLSEGLYQNTIVTTKDGFNEDIDIASVPEDIINGGGTYSGFPTGAVEAAELVVAGADTGTVYYSYLESATSTDYIFASKAVAGAATYALGHNIWRCNFAYFVSSSPTGFNAGNMTIRNNPTTTNVFCIIPTGYSQSYCSAYTVPYGSSIYIDRITGSLRGSTTGSLDGFFWYRPYGESPRYRFPFELQYGSLYFDDVDYLVKIPERTDICPRILTASVDNLQAKINYRVVKIKS